MPCSTTTPSPIRLHLGPHRAHRRKGTTPNADLRATREPRPETTFLRNTGSGEQGLAYFVAQLSRPVRRSIPCGAIRVSRRSWLKPRWAGSKRWPLSAKPEESDFSAGDFLTAITVDFC